MRQSERTSIKTRLTMAAGVALLCVAATALGQSGSDTDADKIPNDRDSCPREAASSAKGSPQNGCPGEGPAEAIFTGFQARDDGGAVVFVQLTDAVKIEARSGQTDASYLMKGAKVLIRNNRNPLLAAEFGSSVSRAQLRPDKDGVRLELKLKAKVSPTYLLVRRGNGAVLEVTVPPVPAGAN